MTSLYGVFQSFDYDSFLREQCSCEKVPEMTYPEGSMMHFIQKNHQPWKVNNHSQWVFNPYSLINSYQSYQVLIFIIIQKK